MKEKGYEKCLLFSGVLSSTGFPEEVRADLEKRFGPVSFISPSIPFTFTDYYNEEMGECIERFFISFSRLAGPDEIREAKLFTNDLEKKYSISGKRKINLDPGLISTSNVVLATTKNRAHRIAIGSNLYAEVTLIYHHKGFESFSWTYADYKSAEVQEILLKMRKQYLEKLRTQQSQMVL